MPPLSASRCPRHRRIGIALVCLVRGSCINFCAPSGGVAVPAGTALVPCSFAVLCPHDAPLLRVPSPPRPLEEEDSEELSRFVESLLQAQESAQKPKGPHPAQVRTRRPCTLPRSAGFAWRGTIRGYGLFVVGTSPKCWLCLAGHCLWACGALYCRRWPCGRGPQLMATAIGRACGVRFTNCGFALCCCAAPRWTCGRLRWQSARPGGCDAKQSAWRWRSGRLWWCTFPPP